MNIVLLILGRFLAPSTDLRALGAEAARKLLGRLLREKWEKAAPGVVKAMQAEGWTVGASAEGKVRTPLPGRVLEDTLSVADVVRDAQFRLWKRVVRSGEVADAFRDSHDDRIVVEVEAAGATELAALVSAVVVAESRLTF